MKHNINELYRVYNTVNNKSRLVTLEYVQANNIAIPSHRDRDNHLVYATTESYHTNNNKPLRVLDVNDTIKLVYLFGEKTYFDSQEELDAYREEYKREQTLSIERNKVKKEILAKLDNMSTSELIKILEGLN